jgi:hypothetical protein
MRNGRVSRATTVALPGRVLAMITAKRSMLYVDPLFRSCRCLQTAKGLRRLIDKWDLDTDEREKTPVYVQDLTEFNETTLRTQEKRFQVGFERIQICLFTMLGIYTVNRLQALLSLQFKHLQFSIQRDPLRGPPIPLVEIRSKHVKRFLGISQQYV